MPIIGKCVLLLFKWFRHVYLYCYGSPSVRFEHGYLPWPIMENIVFFGICVSVLFSEVNYTYLYCVVV